MKKSKQIFLGLFLAAALGALVLYINGCGGGGGKDASSPAAAAASQSGTSGKVAAAVTLSGRVGGRTVGVTTGTVTVNISITGTYSKTGEEFGPITESVVIDLAAGYGVIRVLDIPIGVNHLMVAEADWGGTIETVKAIIPAVEQGETTSVNASAQTTAVANVAIAYAEQEGITLAGIDAETLSLIQLGVNYLVQNGDYAGVSAAEVIALLDELEAVTAITVTPATATVTAGATASFTAALTDSASQAVSASPTWSVTSTLGSIDTNGLFTATGLGSGTVTATFGAISGAAAVTVNATCSIDTDCDDANAATYDVCNNPDTVSATCAHTPYTCVTNTDCDDSNPDTNDICTNGGTLTATCSNPIAAACFADIECDDSNAGTIDTCYNAGTITAVCGHSTSVAAGNITTNTTWGLAGSPYILAGQVQVDSGVTLTIEPGVVVQFDYPNAGSDLFLAGDSTLSGIRVDGTLNAVGTAANPLTFTLSAGSLSNGAGYWGGIYFTGSSTGSALQYANMIYPSYAILVDGSTPAISNIAITEAAAPVNANLLARRLLKTASRSALIANFSFNCTFVVMNTTSNFSMSSISIAYAAGATGSFCSMVMQNISGASNALTDISITGALDNALSLYTVSNLAITNLAITNPMNTGISASNVTDMSCTNCSVTNAGYYGGTFDTFTNLSLSSCVFNNSGSYGLYLYGMDGTNSITNCDVSFNNGYGVYYSGSYNYGAMSITGSRFAQNCSYGINFYTGSGYESAVNISNTNVVDNVYQGIVAGPSNVTSLDGVYLGGNNSAGAGVADTSTSIPDSGTTPQQYTGIGARTNPAATAVSGPATTAGAATCGYY
jgi:hypothetical protein